MSQISGLSPGEVYREVNPGASIILNNFADRNYWLPIYSSNNGLSFNSSGHARITQPNVRNNNLMHQCGIRPKFKLFPAPSGGEIQAELTIGTYVHPIDFAGGDLQGIGFGLFPQDGSLLACLMGGVNVSPNGHLVFATTFTPEAVPLNDLWIVALGAAPTTIQLRVTIRMDMTGNPIKYALGQNEAVGSGVFEYNVDGAGWLWVIKGAFSYPFGHQLMRNGLDFAIGMYGKTNNQNMAGSLTEFKLNYGIIAMH